MTTNGQKMMGFDTPGDKKFSVTMRDWDAMKRAIWRSKLGWETVQRETSALLLRCAHMEGCAGKTDEQSPCLPDCPDREMRLSVLVILNTARQSAPIIERKPSEGPYFAPSREYFSDVLAQLAAAQAELETLRPSTTPELVHTIAPQLEEKTT